MQIASKALGIVDTQWPDAAPIEALAIRHGFEAVVSTQLDSLLAHTAHVHLIVIHAQQSAVLERFIELKGMHPNVHFVIRVDGSDVALVTRLARMESVSVVSVDDLSDDTWIPLFSRGQSDVALEMQQATQTHADRAPIERLDVVFVDPKSQHLLALVERLAVTRSPVLLEGPTGSGKEVLAKTLHELSDRAHQPFVPLNCAAMPEQLVEDMLFGHEKGAFTGANKELPGIFEQANGGTVFLDEIGEMPIHLQAKLLRVLQEKEVVRLGGRQPIQLNFRLVAATNQQLKAAIGEKTFREDLYYRISAFKLQVPKLADRRGDILPLANTVAKRHGCDHAQFTERAMRQLYTYHWPGNVRELDNVIQRALVFSNGSMIDAEHLFFDEPVVQSTQRTESVFQMPHELKREHQHLESPNRGSLDHDTMDLHSAVRASEYDVIMEAIRNTRTREEAAKKLGISPRTLRYKMAKLRDSGDVSHCA